MGRRVGECHVTSNNETLRPMNQTPPFIFLQQKNTLKQKSRKFVLFAAKHGEDGFRSSRRSEGEFHRSHNLAKQKRSTHSCFASLRPTHPFVFYLRPVHHPPDCRNFEFVILFLLCGSRTRIRN